MFSRALSALIKERRSPFGEDTFMNKCFLPIKYHFVGKIRALGLVQSMLPSVQLDLKKKKRIVL